MNDACWYDYLRRCSHVNISIIPFDVLAVELFKMTHVRFKYRVLGGVEII